MTTPSDANTEVDRNDRLWELRAEARNAVTVRVHVNGLRPEFVDARPVRNQRSPGIAVLDLAGYDGAIQLMDKIVTLRAVLQEADKQLARLEVEHRIDVAVEGDEELQP